MGAGMGSLTAALAARVGRVIAIERDRQLAAALATAIGSGPRGVTIDVVTGDALRLDWHRLVAALGARASRVKIIGKIPYPITSPFIAKALTPPLPQRAGFLWQAQTAPPPPP